MVRENEVKLKFLKAKVSDMELITGKRGFLEKIMKM